MEPPSISDLIVSYAACVHQQVTWAILTVYELPLEKMIQLPLETLIVCVFY